MGIVAQQIKTVEVPADFYDRLKPTTPPASVIISEKTFTLPQKPTSADVQRKISRKTVALHKSGSVRNAAASATGSGSLHSRVMRRGVLLFTDNPTFSSAHGRGDPFAKGGYADKIDLLLSGPLGITQGGGFAVRKPLQGIGFGDGGLASGFGGGGDGAFVDDLIGNLMAADESSLVLKQKAMDGPMITPPLPATYMPIIGGRSKASIYRVVMQNMSALRYAYNQRLQQKPGLKGKLCVKFAVDEFGHVIFCEIIESYLRDPQLESEIMHLIKKWAFDKIDKPGDVTEVTYPFVFSM